MASESSTDTMKGAQDAESQFGLSLLASTLAHEIRNPLQTIRLQIDAASRGGSVLSALSTIADNIARLETVVERVQKLSQHYVIHPERIVLKDFVDQILNSVSFWLTAAGITVDTHTQWEGEAVCEGDKELLQQVLLNLIMNAVQAMKTKGVLTIRIAEDLEHANIEVQDTGVGMPPEVLKMVGTPFFTTKENGNGLGLAFCKTIAALHGGSIEIESKQNVGTKVSLRIQKSAANLKEVPHV